MRGVVTAALLMGLALPGGMADAAAQPSAPRPSACALLTRELVAQTSPYSQQQLKLVLIVDPMEDPIGASGSACSYGGITLQIDPFTWATVEKAARDQKWTSLAGVGDVAYYRDNRGEWAELAVRAGQRVLTIQMDVPDGRTAAQVQPNAVALAKALLPTLK
jgi:hypothetical protein